MIEIETYRYYGHFQGDAEAYRPKGEVEQLKEKDPIPRFRNQLIDEGYMTEDEASAIEARVKAEVDAAYTFARESEYPEPEEALEKVFA